MNENNEIPSEYYEALEIDNKIVKKHYPRTNNHQVLEFVFERDPNLYLRKNKILIKGSVEVPDDLIPDTGFVAKLFSMLTVEIDSHAISSNRAKLYSYKYFTMIKFYLGQNIFLLTIFKNTAILTVMLSAQCFNAKATMTYSILTLKDLENSKQLLQTDDIKA